MLYVISVHTSFIWGCPERKGPDVKAAHLCNSHSKNYHRFSAVRLAAVLIDPQGPIARGRILCN